MTKYTRSIQRLTRLCLITLAIIILGWGFGSDKAFWAGMTLGLSIGWLIQLHLARRVHRFGESVSRGEKPPRLGSMTRLAWAGLGAVLVVLYPQHFHYLGLVIGISIPVVFAFGDALYVHLSKHGE